MAKQKALAARGDHPSVDGDDLLARAETGDQAATAQLRHFLETRPGVREALGDLGQQAQLSAMHLVTSGNVVLNEVLARKLTALRADLGGTAPSVLERLLVERILVCWLHVHYADIMAARQTNTSLAQAEYHQRRQDRAQRRCLSAIRTLACVRRLLLPAVQVNIGAQQVNVG